MTIMCYESTHSLLVWKRIKRSLCHIVRVYRSESLSAESRSIQNSPSYRLTKSRSESDLSQPESDEEGYSLVSSTTHHTFYLNCFTLESL